MKERCVVAEMLEGRVTYIIARRSARHIGL